MFLLFLKSRFYWVWPLIFWGLITGSSLSWNLARLEGTIHDIARERGRIMFEMVRSTKINPVLMRTDPEIFRRQVMDDIQYRAVSTWPMNPKNQADPWETKALSSFTKPGESVFERQQHDGKTLYRYIGPVFTQQVCMQCHGYENIQVGDLRGGISVTINAAPIYAEQADTRRLILLTHLGGFLLIALSAQLLIHRLHRQWLQLNETRDQLQKQKAFLSNITTDMGEGCVAVDLTGRVTFANMQSEVILGWRAEEMLGKPWVELVVPQQDDAGGEPIRNVQQTLKDGLSRRIEDASYQHKDGRRFPVSSVISPLHHGDAVDGAVITFTDITERKQAEADRRFMERQLNQHHKMEAVGQLAGGIAHEINTPLQYISQNLRFLQEAFNDLKRLLDAHQALQAETETTTPSSTQLKTIQEIAGKIEIDYLETEIPSALEQSLEGTEQVTHILQAMKEFSSPSAMTRAPTDLNKVIENAVTVSRNEWIHIAETALQLAEDLPKVNCVRSEISQVILILIVNASHAIGATKRETKGTIRISTEQSGEQITIRVSDDGTGIPEEIRESVFNPFFTTKEVGEGSGQGLAIAQDIVVAKHDGELFFETETGRGTTFILRLPQHPSVVR